MRVGGIDIMAASFEELERLIQSPHVRDDQKMFVILARPDYHAWHKARTRERLRNKGTEGAGTQESRDKQVLGHFRRPRLAR